MASIRSYQARYWATNPGGRLLGDVARSVTSRYGTRAEAEIRLAQVIEVNGTAGRPCTGEVEGSEQPPQIFAHCHGHPAQVVGCRCPGCGVVLTAADAALYRVVSWPMKCYLMAYQDDLDLDPVAAASDEGGANIREIADTLEAMHDEGERVSRTLEAAKVKHDVASLLEEARRLVRSYGPGQETEALVDKDDRRKWAAIRRPL